MVIGFRAIKCCIRGMSRDSRHDNDHDNDHVNEEIVPISERKRKKYILRMGKWTKRTYFSLGKINTRLKINTSFNTTCGNFRAVSTEIKQSFLENYDKFVEFIHNYQKLPML